ncbi:cytochrome c biogenesis protein ResB [Thermomonospora cellulosilytica]|uniref:Cytochrome c biogenesis protein n=1 Tax=Thermomonospora cellulosilytica TaxID=1411118 RepID=A0A7W3R6E2_9ACTN|nr:cytochrome c biogenesis protein ResB [Thermomonospora cellulosilytica]MBA9001426.1 cytochrome c biogenesis protein [Thermomonospora cellulosilytica]
MTQAQQEGAEAPVAQAPDGPQPRPRGMGPLGWLRWGWRQLTSMRTALILLFLVALGSVPGSILPQRGQAPEEVAEYLAEHRTVGPWMDRLSLFDVFAAPWFAAVYILLFVSLAGCVIPRSRQHWRAMRSAPPPAPRHLSRLPQSASFETERDAEEVLAEARRLLRGRRFRVADGTGSVAAEKGYLGEIGNLTFHLALLVLLFAVAAGALFGYRGNIVLTEGGGFANSLAYYDQFTPGRQFSPDRLAPFSMRLEDFRAQFVTEPGPQQGQALDFTAKVFYREGPDSPEKPYDLKVNHPLGVGGAKVYVLGHGYAPRFTVRDGQGNVAFRGAVPFLPIEQRNFTSEGVIKVPDARPEQLAFQAVFWPTAVADTRNQQIVSRFPAPLNPTISLMTFKGDLGLDSGTPQSVYRIEGIGRTLQPVRGGSKILKPGETFQIPGGAGSITFDGTQEYISLAINHDPGRGPALAAAVVAIAGIVASFMVRRRRVWVRATPGEGGRTVVEIGGLTLGNPTAEFDDLVAALRRDVPPAGDDAADRPGAGSADETEE